MKCSYKDDFKVDYSGTGLHITKGNDVDLMVTGSQIGANAKACLDSAVKRDSCHELRAAAKAVTGTINTAFGIE